MNKIKRQQSFIQSDDVEIKKLRSKLFILPSPSNKCLENLSNELFYEIFDYLDYYDAYNAFSNLNIRLQNLITCSPIPLKIKLCSDSELVLEHRCRHFVIPNKQRILSLHLTDDTLINAFFKYCIIDSSFHCLESVALIGMTDRQLLYILFYLKSLPRLLSLDVLVEEGQYDELGDIYRLIFSLSTLRYNKLSLINCENEIHIVMPTYIDQKVSFITYLVIDFFCTVDKIIALLSHTPHLYRLNCEGLAQSDEKIEKDSPVTLPQLKYFSAGECQIDFDEFESFLKKISLELEVLRLSVSWNITYLDSKRWERLIKKSIPNLNKLYLNYDQYIDDTFNLNPCYHFINGFTSPFWIEKKWFCELKIIGGEMFFSVHPYRKEWFNFHEYLKIALRNYADNYSTQLTLEAYISIEQTRLFIGKINSSSDPVRFTHLSIVCNGISTGMLIEIISLLPNLDSLRILYLSSLELNTLSIGDTKKHLSVSMINKITKMKLDNVTEEKHIQFLINFCPRMQYLEVDCKSNTDLEMLMKYILVNQMTRIPNLCFLCLTIPTADENMIQNLAKAIELNTMIDSYTIQRIGDQIFLHWKLS